MTGFALIIWSYQAKGSALTTALLSVCSYGPYVLMSIFAGAISDRLNRKVVMLVCDTFAPSAPWSPWCLLRGGHLEIWHLYLLNALNGLMNTVQRAGFRCGHDAAHPPEVLPDGQRNAVLFEFSGEHPDSSFGYGDFDVAGLGGGDAV